MTTEMLKRAISTEFCDADFLVLMLTPENFKSIENIVGKASLLIALRQVSMIT